MKKFILITLAHVMLLCSAKSQYSFGVSPGISFNGAYVGYTLNEKFSAFVGFQFLNTGYSSTVSGKRYNDNGALENYTDKSDMSVNIYVPNIGIKYYVNTKNKLKAYVTANVSKPIVKVSYHNKNLFDSELQNRVNNGLKLFGAEFGFGTEYFFDENFSVGGEFGLRQFNVNYNYDYDDEIYNPQSGHSQKVTTTVDYKYNLSPTYSRISLNYYF